MADRRPTAGQAATTLAGLFYDHLRTAAPAAPLLRSQVRGAVTVRVLEGRRREVERATAVMADACYGVGPKKIREIGVNLAFLAWLFSEGDRDAVA